MQVANRRHLVTLACLFVLFVAAVLGILFFPPYALVFWIAALALDIAMVSYRYATAGAATKFRLKPAVFSTVMMACLLGISVQEFRPYGLWLLGTAFIASAVGVVTAFRQRA